MIDGFKYEVRSVVQITRLHFGITQPLGFLLVCGGGRAMDSRGGFALLLSRNPLIALKDILSFVHLRTIWL